jgi:hypothetical protein
VCSSDLSELVYKGFKTATGEELGTLEKLGKMNWKPFAAFIMQLERGPVPIERDMITPVNMSRATQLKEVYRQGATFESLETAQPAK